jgi:aminoglycoside 3-N-acetyltransferase
MVQFPKTQLKVTSWPQQVGIPPGGNILLMADLTRIAWSCRREGLRFDPAEFIGAFLRHAGTVAIPTFNFDLRPGEVYDVLHTPTISGALGQAALAHPAFGRTMQPLHSFAVAGSLKEEFLRADDPGSFGPASPFALMRMYGFKLLAIDMPLEPAFTYVHHVEECMQVSYRRQRRIPLRYTDVLGHTSRREFLLYAKRPGHINDFKALEPLLLNEGAMVKGSVDGIPHFTVDLQRAHDIIARDISDNKARSIVKFSPDRWLRDVLRPLLKRNGPSRSAMMTTGNAARPH